jgi:hypothetical protein
VCKGERGKERRQRASHPNQNKRAKNAYKLARTKERGIVITIKFEFDCYENLVVFQPIEN